MGQLGFESLPTVCTCHSDNLQTRHLPSALHNYRPPRKMESNQMGFKKQEAAKVDSLHIPSSPAA